MTTQHSTKAQGRWVFALIGLLFLGALIAAGVLVQRVFVDLEQQRSASSDNVQWTLTQVEVDYLSHVRALEYRGGTPGEVLQAAPDLDQIRRRFDVFYSRIDTLRRSRLFAPLREDADFAAPLDRVYAYLDRTLATIDAPDEVLDARIETVWRDALSIQGEVRDLSVAGLGYFASISDARRAQTGSTLLRLAVLSGALLLTLAGLSVYLLFINRKTYRRGRELRQTNQRMNTILSTSLDAVIVVNSAGEVLEFNPAAEAIFGYSFADAKGKSIGDLIVPAHLRDAHSAGMERMQNGGDRHVVGKGRVQLEAMRANGDIFPVELALQSALAGDEEIVIGFVRDISRRVANEKELISARDRALAGEKAKADFLTVMSHEIRTPLNGLLGNLTLLKNADPNREQAQFIRNMEISGQVLLNHVDTVLDIARFEAGKLSVLREATDLAALVQDIVDSQSGTAASRGNAMSWQWIGEASPWVTTDAQRLRQILLNLVGNAIKFTENGRIEIELEVVEAPTEEQEAVYEFRVIDTGLGIDGTETDAVFDDFYTHDPSIGRAAGGTGLGLGIARRFTQAMGGDIGVESTPGEGSVFWIRLPMRRAGSQQPGTHKGPNQKPVGGLDLLVVEDNEINLEVIRNMLDMDGHSVTAAANGKIGVEMAATRRFDAILMDISMPVMDGPTAARHIRTGHGPSAGTSIIAVSANVLPDAVEGFRGAGMDAFVGKPISIDALRKALSAVTEKDAEIPQSDGEDLLETLREALGTSAFDQLMDRFVQEGDAFLAQVQGTNWQQTGFDQLAADSHKLAGSAAMFGALAFREVLIELEMAIKSGNMAAIDPLLLKVRHEWARTKGDLDRAR